MPFSPHARLHQASFEASEAALSGVRLLERIGIKSALGPAGWREFPSRFGNRINLIDRFDLEFKLSCFFLVVLAGLSLSAIHSSFSLSELDAT